MHCIEPTPGGRFPAAGDAARVGGARARGRNVNVALPYAEGGCGDGDYEYLLEVIDSLEVESGAGARVSNDRPPGRRLWANALLPSSSKGPRRVPSSRTSTC